MHFYKFLIFLVFLSCNQTGEELPLKVAQIFSNDMILQQDVSVPIWGQGNPGSTVQISFNDQEFTGKINTDGDWKIILPPTHFGGNYNIVISQKSNTKTLQNVTFGDVWLCGGQSNMEWFVEHALNGKEEVSNANNSDIRVFNVSNRISTTPETDLTEGEWAICNPKSIKQFSAVGYFFGKYLNDELKIPIGLLGSNYGGTVIETWMSPAQFDDMPVYKKQIKALSDYDMEAEKAEGETQFKGWLSSFKKGDIGNQNNEFQWASTSCDHCDLMAIPTLWEAIGTEKLKEFDGVLWFEKTITITKNQLGKAALSLGPIDDSDITWINGVKVGETYNQYNKDRNYTIASNVLKLGVNRITIRIEDYIGGGGIYGEKEDLYLETQGEKINLAGDWNYRIGYESKESMPKGADFGPNSAPTLLYNGMIAPIADFPIKGVIWYQGETNTYRADEYKTLFPKWMKDWRSVWTNDTLPILYVQLANFTKPHDEPVDDIWAELREAQSEALSIPNTAMITAIDLGDANTIHPLNKQDVGKRLGKAALNEVYGQTSILYKSPRFLESDFQPNFVDITFQDEYDALQTKDNNKIVKGFSLAGIDKKFHWAKAEIISKNSIRVWYPDGVQAKAVRYAWAENPDPANVINSIGYPLLPFRTDKWDLKTKGIVRE